MANESALDVFFDAVKVSREGIRTQENHYYPFGLNIAALRKDGAPDDKFQYNGKELQEEHGLLWNDYGARFYDPALGRWHCVDPLAEKYSHASPYNYVENNPISRVDPDGRDWDVHKEESQDGSTHYAFTLNAKVVDETGLTLTYPTIDNLIDRMTTGITESFTGQEGDVSWSITLNLSFAENEDDIEDTDHVFHIINSGTMGSAEADIGGLDIDFNYLIISQADSPSEGSLSGLSPSGGLTLERTTGHEVGHTAGLNHPRDQVRPGHPYRMEPGDFIGTGRRNIMFQSGYVNENSEAYSRLLGAQNNAATYNQHVGMELNAKQVEIIYQRYQAGQLNRKSRN